MIDRLDAIMEVMDEAFDPHWGEAWTHAQVLGSLQFSHTHCLVIAPDRSAWEPGKEAAGFLLSRHAPGEEELLLIGVKPQYRGIGLGRELIEQFAQDAALRGAEKLFLEMRANNEAEHLYRSCGFEPIGQRKAYYRLSDGSRLDAITFGRALN